MSSYIVFFMLSISFISATSRADSLCGELFSAIENNDESKVLMLSYKYGKKAGQCVDNFGFNAMQQDNPLLFAQAESGLAQAVYNVIIANRGARSEAEVNQVIRDVEQAINNNPQKNGTRDGAITAAGGADAAAIMAVVDTEYPAFQNLQAYVAAPNNQLMVLFANAAAAAPLGQVKAINALVDEVFAKIAEDNGTGGHKWKDYPSQTRREMAIDEIDDQLFTDAGINKQNVKDALNLDNPLGYQYTRGEDTGLDAGTFQAIIKDAVLTDTQKELLFNPILEAAKARPRRKDVRDTAVETAVKSVLKVTDLLGAGHQAIANAIITALDAWQKAEGDDSSGASYELQNRGSIPQATYNKIVNYIDTTAAMEYQKLQNPSNVWVYAIVNNIQKQIYDARPQPETIADMQHLVDGWLHTDLWKIAWATEIKNALAAPESGLVNLDPNPFGHAQALYDHVKSLTLTNAKKNHLLQALADASTQANNIRLQTIMTAADDVGLDNSAKRNLLTEFLKIYRTKAGSTELYAISNINGVARKFKVTQANASGFKLKKVAAEHGPEKLGSKEYQFNSSDARLQGIPVEASDYVWFKASELTGPEGNALFWNSHL
ncbi:MAG: hypothetical protein H6731_03015 [Myxococcales bacterium]|nr:MAG: hypothetical protein H6731_03015 [Myxococcales bacterium]